MVTTDVNKQLALNQVRHFNYRAKLVGQAVFRGEEVEIDEQLLKNEIDAEIKEAEIIVASFVAPIIEEEINEFE